MQPCGGLDQESYFFSDFCLSHGSCNHHLEMQRSSAPQSSVRKQVDAAGDGDVELGPADVDLEEVAVIPDDTSNAPGVELADVNVTAPTAGTCNGDGGAFVSK